MKSPRFAVSILAVLFAFLAPLFPYQSPKGTTPPAKKTTPPVKTPAKAPTKAAPATASKAAPKGGATTAASAPKGRQRKPVPRRPPVQNAPTPDRVKEIQEALAGHGYTTPVDGVWGKETEVAMAKFQEDQNLEGRGKLTALSLIALGLGPQKDPAAPKPVPEKE